MEKYDYIFVFWSHFEAVDGNIVKLSVETGYQVFPHCSHRQVYAPSFRKGLHDIDLETYQFICVFGIGNM